MTSEEIEKLPWYEEFVEIIILAREIGWTLESFLEKNIRIINQVYVPELTDEIRQHMLDQDREVFTYIFNKMTN